MQFPVDVVNGFPQLGEPEVDFFPVVRLPIAFDQAFSHELPSQFAYGAHSHIKRLRKFCHI
jgi:hypothetical protein